MVEVVDQLIEIYGLRAEKRYGLSAVNQLQHGLQAAALAEAQGESAAFITAALLHDIGHMVHDLGEDPAALGVDDLHEAKGAAWLETHFGPEVTEPVRLHVPAKRYLCATDPDYFGKLTEDSVRSLALQGGPMSADEVARFRQEPHHEAAVRLRQIDEAAKVPAMQTPAFEHFLGYVDEALAHSHAGA
jgi:[1-hydroxy-2-(trimethylamino)ethyl]phosphonate dioxygenase